MDSITYIEIHLILCYLLVMFSIYMAVEAWEEIISLLEERELQDELQRKLYDSPVCKKMLF